MIVDLNTARALGIDIRSTLLAVTVPAHAGCDVLDGARSRRRIAVR